MTRKRKILLAIAGAFAVSIVAVALYLTFSDLSGWRDTVARLASKGMARELTIGGEFEVDLGIVTKIHATELSLANTGWGSEPEMASIDRLNGEINLWELLSGSIHLPRIDIEGGRALFESDPHAGSNWALGKPAGKAGGGGPVRLRIDAIRARSVDLVFRTASAERDWDVAIAELDSTGDDMGSHRLSGMGTLRAIPFDIRGEIGSLEGLINLGSIRHDLELKLGQSSVSSAGFIAELDTLGGLDVESEISIPDPTEITTLVGLPEAPLRSFTGRLQATPIDGTTSLRAELEGPAASLAIDGTLDSVLRPGDLELDLRYHGPDVRPVAGLLGVTGLPERPFDVSGHVRWQGFPVEVSGLEITVGDNRISADGSLGEPPQMLDTDFRVHGSGPNIAVVAALVGLELPHDPFSIDGRLVRVDNGLEIEQIRGTVGPTRIAADGFVGDPPAYRGTRLDVELHEPDLSRFAAALGLALPDEPLTIRGRLAQGTGGIELVDTSAEVGDARLSVDGSVTTTDGMVGTDLRFDCDGLELSDVAALLEIDGLPESPIRAGGRVTVVEAGFELDRITVELTGAILTVSGFVAPNSGLHGSSMSIEATGDDASLFDPILPTGALPPEAFRVAGDVSVEPDAVVFDALEVALGGATGRIDGVVGTLPDLAGSEVDIRFESPSLASLDPLLPGVRLPDIPFSVVGGVAASGVRVELRSLDADLDVISLRLDGVLDLSDRFEGSQLSVVGEGDDLGALAAGIGPALAIELPVMPNEPFTIAADLSVDEVGIRSENLELTVGNAAVSAAGVVGHWPGMIGTDVELHAEGSTASLAWATAGAVGPELSIDLAGRIRHDANGTDFDDVRFLLGEYRGEIDGRLGRFPKLAGTSLALRASGPDLVLLRDLTGVSWLPSLPFEIEGRFDGEPNRFETDGLRLRLGSSDVEGDLRVDLETRPRVTANLRSRRLAAAELLRRPAETVADADESDIEESPLLVPDEPWNLSVLDRVDVDLDWSVDRLDLRLNTYRDVRLVAGVENSRLEVERFSGLGGRGGTLESSGALFPHDDGSGLEIRLELDDAMVNLGGEGTPPERFTPVDVSVAMDATGRSPHGFLARSNGRIVVTAEHGLVRRGIFEILSADVFATLLNAINPFRQREELTRLECAVLAATFDAGVMTLEPAAIQTDKLTILGEGTVDFSTEELKLDWVTKPRKGVGLSASAITNSYIRLGGTLMDPNLEIKPLEAVATTGVAVVTMGISLVAKGLFDRVTAEKKVCEKARKKVAEMEAETRER